MLRTDATKEWKFSTVSFKITNNKQTVLTALNPG